MKHPAQFFNQLWGVKSPDAHGLATATQNVIALALALPQAIANCVSVASRREAGR